MRNTKWFNLISLLAVFSLAVVACTGQAGANQPTATTVPVSAATDTVAPTTASTATSMPTVAASDTPAATMAATTAPASTATAAPTALTAGPCPLQVEANATITFSGWGDQSEQKVYQDSITRFKTVCPDVTVTYNPIPSDFQTKLKAQMAGGTAPDVFYVDDQLMNAFAPNGQLLALDDLMTQANVSRSDFIPQLVNMFTLDSKTYGLPKDWGTLGLIYLPSAFTDAGIAAPTDSWTWTDLITAAKAIQAKGKIAGFCQDADYARLAPWVFSNGGSYTSPDFKTSSVDSTQVTDMVTLVANMKLQDKSLVTPKDVGASWCGEAIGKQLAAMTLEGGWMVNFMNTTYPDVKWAAAEIPQGPTTRADVIFTNAIGINAATKFPKAAAAFLFFVTGRYNQGMIQQTGFAYSTHPDQLAQITNPYDTEISKGGLLPDTKVDYWGLYSGNVRTAISNALSRVYLGAQSVADSFKQADTDVQNALDGK
jgi:multiple sugar transport system substrate-binding protein